MKNYISLVIFIIITILIASCGTNTPSSTTSPISKTNISSPTVGTITAYQGTVHKQVLTSHAIDILLLPENPGNLTKKQLTLLRTFRNDIEQGAWDEDYYNPYGLPNVLPIFRTINHFMDPQHGNIVLSDPPFSGTPYSAIDWVYNGDSYMYLTAKQNFVVNIAGYDPNNTLMNTSGLKISMTDLGHVLHMFQDMSVPPHVRNDNHSGLFGASSSRYEDIGLASDPGIHINTMSPINITNDDDLYSKFIYLARTTSENFFSEDTIPDPNNPPPPQRQFPLPTLPSGIGYLPNQNTPLVIAQKDMRTGLIKYKLNDANDTIPYYYASQLMPKAISYTAGVIKYFLNLKTTGKVVINSHTDGQHVTSTPITVSGYLTYYAPEVAISIPNGTAIRTVVHASTTLSGGHYAFSYPVNLYSGSNQITVTADNENVEATSATITVIYDKNKPKDPPPPPPPAPPSPPGGPGNNGGGSTGGNDGNTPTPPTSPTPPPTVPGSPSTISPSSGIGGLMAADPALIPCLLSNPHINPDATGPLTPFDQLCGDYFLYITGVGMAPATPANFPSLTKSNHYGTMKMIQALTLPRVPFNNAQYIVVGTVYNITTLLTLAYTIQCNDPCFQGKNLPDDTFTGSGFPPGTYIAPNGTQWQKQTNGSVTAI